jgi:hypothetical protein
MKKSIEKTGRWKKYLISMTILAIIFDAMILLSVFIPTPWVRVEINSNQYGLVASYDYHPFEWERGWSKWGRPPNEWSIPPLVSDCIKEGQWIPAIALYLIKPILPLVAIIAIIWMKFKQSRDLSSIAVFISLFSLIYGIVSLVPIGTYLWKRGFWLSIPSPEGLTTVNLQAPFYLCLFGCIFSILLGITATVIWYSKFRKA